MTETSHNLNLPFITAAQAQKHVTHNEALRALDVIVQLSVLSRGVSVPPVMPENGDHYIIGENATSSWEGRDSDVAAFQDGTWAFYTPRPGWLAWTVDENAAYIWTGAAWTQLQINASGSDTMSPFLGVNTAADETNKLAVK